MIPADDVLARGRAGGLTAHLLLSAGTRRRAEAELSPQLGQLLHLQGELPHSPR